MESGQKRLHEAFRAMLNRMVERRGGYGEQSRIARALGLTSQYVNAVTKGHKQCSIDVQYKIAKYFGMEYFDFQQAGEAILRGKTFYPHKARFEGITDPQERAFAVVEQAEKELGIEGYVTARRNLITSFVKGEIAEASLYEGIHEAGAEVFARPTRVEAGA